MKHVVRSMLLSTVLVASAWLIGQAHAADAADAADATDTDERQNIIVNGVLVNGETASATGLTLSLRETPQSVSIMSKERVKDFALTNVNDLLTQVVGINVERAETDRTYYNSRGFDITNFQVDGIGMPLLWGLQTGDLDTALWERVETIRGANGLMTGVGNPSATINYVRKRPTEDFQASVQAMGGSWDQWRIDADVSGPLNASGTIRARAIYAHDEHDSYLDYYKVNRDVYGGILAWDLTPQLTATVGYTRQENNADGVMWGALPLTFSDGTRIPLDVSATSGADWTYWNTVDQSAFGELHYAFDNGWSLKGVYTYKRLTEDAKLLYASGYPDPETGLGVVAMSGLYPAITNQYLVNLYASGPFQLFGRQHELSVSLSQGISHSRRHEAFADLFDYPSVFDWGTAEPAEPVYPESYLAEDLRDKIQQAAVAAHLNFTDQLKSVVGFSATRLTGSGESYFVDQARKNSKVTPYIGLLYDLIPNVTAYASYTGIFNPQKEYDSTNHRLAPATGNSIEAGLKSEWFDGRLYASAALFRAKQKNLADYAGTFEEGEAGQVGGDYYGGVDTTSKGFELEIAGNITDNWDVSGGLTILQIHNEDGDPTRLFIPTQTFKLSTTYSVPELRNLKLGAQFRAQNRIRYYDPGLQDADGNDVLQRQGSYAILDLMAGIDIVDRVRATVNVRNVTDRKYLGSLQWGQAFYAAPRSVMVSVGFNY